MSNNAGLTKIDKMGFIEKAKLLPSVIKSFWSGDGILNNTIDPQTYHGEYTTQNFYQWIRGIHTFNRKALEYLVETGYCNNPAGFGIIQKIFLASKNIVFKPYRNGKPYKSGSFDLDMGASINNLCKTGNVFIWNKESVGFGKKPVVLNTLKMEEVKKGNTFQYWYYLDAVTRILIPEEDLVHRKFIDPVKDGKDTRMGLSPLQAALMPIEALKEMYIADTSLLKNKGVDVLITNGSDTNLIPEEQEDMDRELNKRIGGARKAGGVATSTSKLQVMNLGRSIKELALWDGYKIKKRDLCDALQVDSGLFNDPDNKTFANRAEAEKSLYTSCVIPYCHFILDDPKLKQWLGFDVFIDTSNIECLQISQGLRFEKNKTITDAIINLNQQVKNGVLTNTIAISILVNEWGYDSEEAAMLISDPSGQEPAAPVE